jgi:hypothetical protein
MVFVSACDNNATYDDDAKIAKTGDSSSSSMSSSSSIGNNYKKTITLTGTQTIWRYNAKDDEDVAMSYMLSVTKGGKAKLVLITPDSEVITLIENTDNTTYDEMQTHTVSVKKGVNRIKIVGYESPRIELKMHIESGRFS